MTFSKKKYDPYTRRISEITVSEESHYINFCKILFQTALRQETLETGPNTVEIWTMLPLPYLLIPVKIIQLEKVYVSAMQNLKTVC